MVVWWNLNDVIRDKKEGGGVHPVIPADLPRQADKLFKSMRRCRRPGLILGGYAKCWRLPAGFDRYVHVLREMALEYGIVVDDGLPCIDQVLTDGKDLWHPLCNDLNKSAQANYLARFADMLLWTFPPQECAQGLVNFMRACGAKATRPHRLPGELACGRLWNRLDVIQHDMNPTSTPVAHRPMVQILKRANAFKYEYNKKELEKLYARRERLRTEGKLVPLMWDAQKYLSREFAWYPPWEEFVQNHIGPATGPPVQTGGPPSGAQPPPDHAAPPGSRFIMGWALDRSETPFTKAATPAELNEQPITQGGDLRSGSDAAPPDPCATPGSSSFAVPPSAPRSTLSCGHRPDDLREDCRFCQAHYRAMEGPAPAPLRAAARGTASKKAATALNAAPMEAATAEAATSSAATSSSPPRRTLSCGHRANSPRENCVFCQAYCSGHAPAPRAAATGAAELPSMPPPPAGATGMPKATGTASTTARLLSPPPPPAVAAGMPGKATGTTSTTPKRLRPPPPPPAASAGGGPAPPGPMVLPGQPGRASDIAEPCPEREWSPEAKQLSKWMSFLLRHDPDFAVDTAGYAAIEHVLSHPRCPSRNRDLCLQVIANSNKSRFGIRLDDNGRPQWVRANQGHSICKGVRPEAVMERITGRGLSLAISISCWTGRCQTHFQSPRFYSCLCSLHFAKVRRFQRRSTTAHS